MPLDQGIHDHEISHKSGIFSPFDHTCFIVVEGIVSCKPSCGPWPSESNFIKLQISLTLLSINRAFSFTLRNFKLYITFVLFHHFLIIIPVAMRYMAACQLGLTRVVGRNDCYPPHLGSILTSDMLSS
jgi:hypothetical protein